MFALPRAVISPTYDCLSSIAPQIPVLFAVRNLNVVNRMSKPMKFQKVGASPQIRFKGVRPDDSKYVPEYERLRSMIPTYRKRLENMRTNDIRQFKVSSVPHEQFRIVVQKTGPDSYAYSRKIHSYTDNQELLQNPEYTGNLEYVMRHLNHRIVWMSPKQRTWTRAERIVGTSEELGHGMVNVIPYPFDGGRCKNGHIFTKGTRVYKSELAFVCPHCGKTVDRL